MTATLSRFEDLVTTGSNKVNTSLLLFFAWIATCDGVVDPAEVKRLEKIAAASHYHGSVQELLEIAMARDLGALQLASEVIRFDVGPDAASIFMTIAIDVAIADGVLSATENHLLRLLADIFGLTRKAYSDIFEEVTGHPLPPISDVSSAAFWASRRRDNSESDSQQEHQSHGSRAQTIKTPLEIALATLGVSPGATKDDIKRAYRRLAQVHHPDRFVTLGTAAVAAATDTFQRIGAAYELAVKHA